MSSAHLVKNEHWKSVDGCQDFHVNRTNPKKSLLFSETDRIEEIDKKLSTNFDKILMNQDIFMDSCHRLQMDEPQIEREISTMLEKLIDMLEKK